ncbi:MAG: sporulation protein YunB [Clostridiales bacterium]|jgi:sporulation protein YunB|nr:sporulation protein YunB [Clostridiales bacterium]
MWRQDRGQQKKRKWFILMLICAVLIGYGILFTDRVVKPAIASIGEIRAKSMMVQVVNEVVREKYETGNGFSDLLDIRTDEAGKITLVQANSSAMNRLSYDIAWEIQQRLKNLDEEQVKIPIGSVLGNQILSQTGPWVKLKILPLGTTKIDFMTEFTEAGINQTKYKIYLEVINTAKVVVPFSEEEIQVETTLLVAEAVILGEIPDSYVQVPDRDILDGMDLDSN